MHGQRLLFVGAGLLVACSSSSHPSGPTTGVVRGAVTSSLGGGLTGLSVTVTPASGAVLPAVVTGAGGAFSVPDVPIGSGSVIVSGQSSLCAAPKSTAYSFDSGDTAVANVSVSCTQPTGSLAGFVAANYGALDALLYLSSATITVIPAGGIALPPVTAPQAYYHLDSVPLPVVNGQVQPGSGKIVIGGTLPAGCPAQASVSYSGLTAASTPASPLMVQAYVPCTGSTLSVNVTWLIDSGLAPASLYGPTGLFVFQSLYTRTFSPVVPGAWYVTAFPLGFIYDSILGVAANLHLSGTPVTLAPGASATITVDYVERPGSGQIWLASSRGATGYTPNALIGSGIASGNTIGIPSGAGAIAIDGVGNLWTTGPSGVAEYAVSTLPRRSGSYAAPTSPTSTFALPHASTGAAGLTFDAAGHLWVADIASAAIYEYAVGSTTPLVTISGSPLRAPMRIVFDVTGDLWVADTLARSVFMYAAAQVQTSGSPTPQTLSLTSIFPGGGPYAIAFDGASLDLFIGGATADSGLVAWYPGLVYPQNLTAPYNIWRFAASPTRPAVLDLAIDATNDVWVVANNGVVNFVWDSTLLGNANPPVAVASARDLGGLAFDLSPLGVLANIGTGDTAATSATKARRRPPISRRGGLSHAGARP